MTTAKGWFIRSKEPNNLFWSLMPVAENGWTQDVDHALLFAREVDAQNYFEHHFHPGVKEQFEVAGIH